MESELDARAAVEARAAIVVCNGRISDYSSYGKYFDNADFVICADGGAYHLREFGIVPDIMLGDFDSIDLSDYEFFSSKTNVLKYPVKKDQTDSEIAVLLAAKKGFNPIYLIGAMGNRIDHTMANIMLMFKLLDMGITCVVADEHNELYALKDNIILDRPHDTDGNLAPAGVPAVDGVPSAAGVPAVDGVPSAAGVPAPDGVKVSIIPITRKIAGVSTRGLLYQLNDAEIELGSTFGVSNEFTEDRAEIKISGGLAVVILAWD